jgi:hypothetical protein
MGAHYSESVGDVTSWESGRDAGNCGGREFTVAGALPFLDTFWSAMATR